MKIRVKEDYDLEDLVLYGFEYRDDIGRWVIYNEDGDSIRIKSWNNEAELFITGYKSASVFANIVLDEVIEFVEECPF